MNPYIGHPTQLGGVEEHRLVGGKGDGMRLYEIRNGQGLELTVVPDRCCDIARLRVGGRNLSYLSPCGYVAPAYYEKEGAGWLKSFTAGFLTTCGLESVGGGCVDEGEEFYLHGSIANQPAEHSYWEEDEKEIRIHGLIRDEVIFGRKLVLHRLLRISKEDNSFVIEDTIENTGDQKQNFEILYHMNMGYPLLDEDSILNIPSVKVMPRDEHAAEDIEHWMEIIKPQEEYQERCYYHVFPDADGKASIYQPKLNMGLEISFDAKSLDGFVEWKMMGVRDYVLGLECGNCYPDGRSAMRKSGMLKELAPGEKITYRVRIKVISE